MTNTLGSLRTLSGVVRHSVSSHKDFNLFTHHERAKKGEPYDLSYQALREAVLELFLSVKIRSDDEIDNYNEGLFKQEKAELLDIDGFSLID